MVAISSSCWIRSYTAAAPAKSQRVTCLGGAGCDGAPMAVAIASALPRYFCQTIVGLPATRWHSRAYQYGWPRMIFFRRLTAMVSDSPGPRPVTCVHQVAAGARGLRARAAPVQTSPRFFPRRPTGSAILRAELWVLLPPWPEGDGAVVGGVDRAAARRAPDRRLVLHS